MLHVILEYNIGEIIHQDNIIVILNNTEYKIPVGNLLIRKYQIYTLNNIGLTSINTSDIYDTKENGYSISYKFTILVIFIYLLKKLI